jgi:serine carboxypeptidase-like clade 2
VLAARCDRYVDGQLGGRITEYDGLTFTTIRNAGHMVPYTQPSRALHMFKSWINGTPF